MRIPALICVALAVGLSLFSTRAQADVDHDPQVWTAVLGNASLTNSNLGPKFWLDAHLRRTAGGVTHLFRPGAGYAFSPILSLWAGYAWIPTVPDEGDTEHEQRAWQQVIVKKTLSSGLSLQSRTRFEQRFGPGDDLGFRAREFLRVSYPLAGSKTFGFVSWDELFIGLNDTDWGPQAGFDQNRLFAGLYGRMGSRLRAELGYLSTYLNRKRDQMGHVLAANLFWKL